MLKETLTPREKEIVEAARRKAFLLYEGKAVRHRSCGIALAETFGLPPRPYQALRRGGITGDGPCGAIGAGLLVLGEFLGDPDPTGPPTPLLKEAAARYREEWIRRVDRGPGGRDGGGGAGPSPGPVQVETGCNRLTEPQGDFGGDARKLFCTNIASTVAEIVAEILLRAGTPLEIRPAELGR